MEKDVLRDPIVAAHDDDGKTPASTDADRTESVEPPTRKWHWISRVASIPGKRHDKMFDVDL